MLSCIFVFNFDLDYSAKNIEVLNFRKFYKVLSTLKSPMRKVPCNIEVSTKRSSIRCLKKFGWKAQ